MYSTEIQAPQFLFTVHKNTNKISEMGGWKQLLVLNGLRLALAPSLSLQTSYYQPVAQ